MFLLGDRVVYSASDLSAAAACEYAMLRTLDAKLGRIEAVHASPDPMLDRTSALGMAHERRQLAAFQKTFGAGVSIMPRPERTELALADANAATIETALWGYDVLYQATFFDGRFLGFCDFLVKEGSGYSVYDTKLSRHARVPALLQLAAYADALQASGIEVAEHLHLMLGDGSTSDHASKNLLPVFRRQRAHLEDILDEHVADGDAVDWADPRYTKCGRCEACDEQVLARDDLLLVAGLSGGHRAHLIDAGISTTAELATTVDTDGTVDGVSARILKNLRAQAALQVKQRSSGRTEYDVYDADALGAIPQPDAGDIFFDFEGDPLWAEPGSSEWGLEYLFGVLDTDGNFAPFWAHDRVQERAALKAFLDYVVERRRRFPAMHIYHYAAYEKTALLRLAGRYGVGEEIVDNLLRENVLVDLYPVVRAAVRVGERSYSIKKLEPLYMPTSREGDVTDAAASIVEYANWCDLRDEGRTEEADALLAEIAEYNRYDCESTIRLRDWLLARAAEHGVSPRETAGVGADPDSVDGIDNATPLEEALREFAGFTGDRTDVQQAVALYGGSIGYHRRERKPFWWAHFDRLQSPVDEWPDSTDVMKVDSGAVESVWAKTTPRQKLLRRRVRLNGTVGAFGKTVRLLYDVPAPGGLEQPHPTYRACSRADVVEVGTDFVIVEEKLVADADPYEVLPMALAPDAPIRTVSMEAAIVRAAAEVHRSLPELPRTAVADLTSLSPPRTVSGEPLPSVVDDDYAAAIASALLDLDGSYLAVQGPPGTGKTYTAAAVIARLVQEHHWRIGVVAQSHSVVENLLDAIAKAGVAPALVGKKAPTEHTLLRDADYPGFVADATEGCVVGGTAWDFSHEVRVVPGSLDVLVIDEAGQFSLANTIAVAGSARNLLLLGDPQQLPQVSQGTHPEPVDESALGWLAAGHGALPAERGYFLSRTWRMHPELCAPVSALSYEGKLFSNEEATKKRILDGVAPGLHTVTVDHHDNTTESPEEAEEIRRQIEKLLGSPWTSPDTHDGTRGLTPGDFIVVAPYNAQVATIRDCLDRAGLTDVLVGTVDKFQGRQAPISIVSMTASNLGDSPRGASFLLSRNRLNVAISRGQWAAFVVQARTSTHYLPATPDGLEALGAFMALTHPE